MTQTRQQRRRAERKTGKTPDQSQREAEAAHLARTAKMKRRAALMLVIGALLQFTALMVDSNLGDEFGEARDMVYYGLVGLGFVMIVVAGAVLGRAMGLGKPKRG
jgi:hypothetical protein